MKKNKKNEKKNKKKDVSEIERLLEEQYVLFFIKSMGMPDNIAKEIFKAILKEIKEASEQEGTNKFPENFGNILLQQEKVDDKVREAFAMKRKDYVSNSDIVLWWNLHDIERRMICKVDEMNRTMLFEKLVHQDKLEQEEAAKQVALNYPIYGDPDHMVIGTPIDRPLPYELKWRVNRYVNKRKKDDPEEFKKQLNNSSSFNALLREAIKEGEL